ncbi:MAG: hypothetical protein AUJ31_01855 [Parcubacteria group bacterium CG1_02_39_15]|nr:MAG: hypothetical protein AUJ31_01855 [Parcubacteria group bacterium CG1_02_39_15]
MRKLLISLLLFYILILLQVSFLPHFFLFSWSSISNLAFIIIFLIFYLCFSERPEKNSGIIPALFAGFFLDIFSGNFLGIDFLGFWTFILAIIAIFIKFFLRRYVRFPLAQ